MAEARAKAICFFFCFVLIIDFENRSKEHDNIIFENSTVFTFSVMVCIVRITYRPSASIGIFLIGIYNFT